MGFLVLFCWLLSEAQLLWEVTLRCGPGCLAAGTTRWGPLAAPIALGRHDGCHHGEGGGGPSASAAVLGSTRGPEGSYERALPLGR